MFDFPINGVIPEPPTLFFTISGHPRALLVINHLRAILSVGDHPLAEVEIIVFASEAEAAAAFKSRKDGECVRRRSRAVAIWDSECSNRRFRPFSRSRSGEPFPSWSQGVLWGIGIGPKIHEGATDRTNDRVRNIAEQMCAWFGRQFTWITRTDRPHFPWGPTAKNEKGVVSITLPSETTDILARLNGGPDMAGEVNERVRAELPKDSRISWIRVPGAVASYPRLTMERTLRAIAAFERASAALVDQPGLSERLLAGVDIPDRDPAIVDAYLHPRFGDQPITEWSVRRPDMHVNGNDLVSSENDEMPGGFFDLWHVDEAYGINADGWQAAFDWLLSEGPLAIVVSDQWSQVYLSSARWMADKLCAMDRRVMVITTPEVEEMVMSEQGVFFRGERIGTVWRQFPVFETKDGLARLVMAAQEGRVRMVPEFAHFGSKTWYALFWENQHAFAARMAPEDFALLQKLVPRSRLVLSSDSTESLFDLSDAARAQWVLKLTGASDRTARSLGVVIGLAQTKLEWEQWIRERIDRREPFIVQHRFDTSVEEVAVYNTRTKSPELFPCKVLMRPWMLGGRLISTSCAVTPKWTTKVHGMVDMAVVPVQYV